MAVAKTEGKNGESNGKPLEFEIVNDGPIERLEISAPPGSVTVLNGPNGSGKTTALNEIGRALGGKAPKSTRRDGALKGHVKGPGVLMRVTATGSGRPTGELEAELVDAELTIADIVDPGVKDPVAADRRRIEALCRVLGRTASVETFAPAFEDTPLTIDEVASDKARDASDVVDMARLIKRDADERAREIEADAQKLESDAAATESLYSGLDLDGECDAEALESAVEAARDKLSELKVRSERAGEAGEPEGEYATDQDVADLEATLEASEKRYQAASEIVDELQDELDAARKNRDDLDKEWSEVRIQLEQARNSRRAAELREQRPSDEEVESAKQQLESARRAVEAGALVRKAKESLPKAKELRRDSEVMLESAGKVREAGKKVLGIIGDLLGVGKFKVDEEGRLLAKHRRRSWMPYAEMSDGERWELAIQSVADEFKDSPHSLLILPQAAWQDLDATARGLIAKAVKGTSLSILTGEARGQRGEPISVEQFTGA